MFLCVVSSSLYAALMEFERLGATRCAMRFML
jgi:hypothetical protein